MAVAAIQTKNELYLGKSRVYPIFDEARSSISDLALNSTPQNFKRGDFGTDVNITMGIFENGDSSTPHYPRATSFILLGTGTSGP
jgi:hypothetical protein